MIFAIIIFFTVILFLSAVIIVPSLFSLKKMRKQTRDPRLSSSGQKTRKYTFQLFFVILMLSIISLIIMYKSTDTGEGPEQEEYISEKKSRTEIFKELLQERERSKEHYGAIMLSEASTKKASPSGERPARIKDPGEVSPNQRFGGQAASEEQRAAQESMLRASTNIPGSGQPSGSSETKNRERPSITSLTFAGIKSLAEVLIPSSIKTPQDTSMAKKPKDKSLSPAFATAQGARLGDFFIYSYFDLFRKGYFRRSDSLIIVPPHTDSDVFGTVILGLDLPPLKKNETIQLPVLIKGSVIPDIAGYEHFEIDKTGSLTANQEIGKFYLRYTIARGNVQTYFMSDADDSDNLAAEYQDIPYRILQDLQEARGASDMLKLNTIADIFNNYFEYQTGLSDLKLEEDRTWCNLLAENLDKNTKFPGDCDILSTYAYIFLRYMGLRPYYLIGFLKTLAPAYIIRTTELHATIYLKASGEWMIFDPSFFASSHSPADPVAEEASDDSLMSESLLSVEAIKKAGPETIKKTIMESGIKYFISGEYALTGHGSPTSSSASFSTQSLISGISFLPQDIDVSKYKKLEEVIKKANIIPLVLSSSLLIYFFGLLFSILLAFTGINKYGFLPMPSFHLLVFFFCVSLSTYSILEDPGYNMSLFQFQCPVCKLVGAVLCASAALISIITLLCMLPVLAPDRHIETLLLKIRTGGFIFSGALISLAAVLYAPSIPSLASMVLVVKIVKDFFTY